MIHRFIKIGNGLFRGSAPTVEDVIVLDKHFGIKKIVSLDENAGKRIERICKLLGIEHIVIPLNGINPVPLIQLFSYNLEDLLLKNKPTFVHCIAGKDRTGMVVAMFKCMYEDMSCEDAINEAESLGFGVGLSAPVIHLYKKLICKACKKNHDHADTNIDYPDTNNLDIVDNMVDHTRDYNTDFEESVVDEATMTTFAPYLDVSRQYPYDPIYNSTYEYNERAEKQNKLLDKKPDMEVALEENNDMPWVGLYDNDSGIKGIGPVDNGGGFTAT